MSDSGGHPTRRGRGRGRQRTQSVSIADDVEGDQSPHHTPTYDPRYGFPYFDAHQTPPATQDTSFCTPQLGDPSMLTVPTPSFYQTFGHHMPYNTNLVLSLMGSTQQPQSTQPPPMRPEPLLLGPPIHTQPPHTQPSGSQPAQQPSEPMQTPQTDASNANKVLLEPEGDT